MARAVSTRHKVTVSIFATSVSFQAEEDGYAHQMPMPGAPDPDALPSVRSLIERGGANLPPALSGYFARPRPIELKPVDLKRYLEPGPADPVCNVWLRAASRLPDDPAIHRAVLAYASDMTLLDATLIAHGRSVFDPDIQGASLDHALWFHRPFRADSWLLYTQDSPSTGGARGFARGQIFAQDGTLVASVAQEGLIRPRKV